MAERGGMLGRFFGRLASAIAEAESVRMEKTFAADPELQRLIKEQEATQNVIQRRLERQMKDPEFAQAYDELRASRNWSTYGFEPSEESELTELRRRVEQLEQAQHRPD